MEHIISISHIVVAWFLIKIKISEYAPTFDYLLPLYDDPKWILFMLSLDWVFMICTSERKTCKLLTWNKKCLRFTIAYSNRYVWIINEGSKTDRQKKVSKPELLQLTTDILQLRKINSKGHNFRSKYKINLRLIAVLCRLSTFTNNLRN